MQEAFTFSAVAVAAAATLAALPLGLRRLELSRAKHPSLTGHARIAKRLAALLPGYEYSEERFFASDGAPADVVAWRRDGLASLAAHARAHYPQSLAASACAREGLPDLAFTSAYRVPFPYSPYLRAHLQTGAFLRASRGVMVEDLDGNAFYDLTGSYGVNVFGYDFYKECIAEGAALVQSLGPVLGAYHPCVHSNVARLRAISSMDAVSFHMSGTEAVMQAVRLARYHTGRSRLVRFSGAYHGWWGDVQPGPGNPVPARDTFTLREMDERSLRVLRKRRDIACVLVNPLQALHPNAGAPGDSSLTDSSRRAAFDRDAYVRWLKALREVCTARGIALIFDEVFVGFRLAPGGAQEYFGVRADMVTYGKTLGGGLPVGVVCGRADLMKRFREDRPADICFARGTFNSHPYVMGAMHAFLNRIERPEVLALYDGLDARWNERAERLNRRLREAGLPVQVANLSSIWTVLYTAPSRYNWMLQFYLRREGLALSWVGTGRLIFSLDYTDADFDAVVERFVAAARAMQADGWWWHDAALTDKAIRRTMLREMIAQRW
ncbi:aminotransferase class III-fold pyridoxal phosphate-dependent enzyme [Variovorax sp. J22R133]|uniref:aminotransferase class III-fold pyridoxal phosphate-dependent enzyme n=1 Tax=Variovorax brevis TaxID=3053503 RepID=UPI002577775F|nr:aminotransferase class III-fold pyridoxal phosphate-dependent enzyme [Variovorax sp. J22R133]MDM0112728.1 aminotransferase class III-fold pyridoxal phosphate-dependent enzyme [Variovorax sp. J22R133]